MPNRSATKNGVTSAEVTDWGTLVRRFPNRWVALEITEVTRGVGWTRARVIGDGAESKVAQKLDEFVARNPGKQVGMFFTGRRVKPGQDVFLASR